MSENPGTSSGPAPPKKRGNPRWRPYRRFNNASHMPRQKPIAFQINSNDPNELQSGSSTPPTVIPNQKSTTLFLNTKCDDYPIWHLYFPDENYDKNSIITKRVKIFEEHFKSNQHTYNYIEIKMKLWFNLNIQFLLSDTNFISTWSTFKSDLIENPEMILSCAAVSMHQLVLNHIETTPTSLILRNRKTLLNTIQPRLYGFGPVTSLKSLRGCSYGRLIAICGTVIRAESAKVYADWFAYKCPNCNTEQVVKQPDGITIFPTSCKGQCRTRSNFIPLLSSPYTRTVQYQTIKIQETILGQVPKTIEAELTEDLVDLVCPGDDITITGILKIKPQEEIQRKDQPSLHRMYIKAVSISTNKDTLSNRISDFTQNDMEAIKMISEEPSLFRFLVQSLCPKIYGHEMVKAGLLLSLFGATASPTEEKEGGKRTEIHVLVVGDPGVGKSHMLQSCANVSPRGVFVCGSSSSSVGLTVSVRHGGAVEAGALVLADEGVCCIDEFDKMSSNYRSLLEVMEDRMVSVAKAGVYCKIPARTSVLAAANPKSGHYDRSKTVSENLKMNPALLSRFDLVFILLDRPNVRLDNLLTLHIQALNEKKNTSNSWNTSNKENSNQNEPSTSFDNRPLDEKLKLLENEKLDLLPPVLLQKYIAYARKNIRPQITKEAAEEIKKFYLELREVRIGPDCIPVTIRQLEGLIRLTQARAKLELASEATIEHALDVIAIVRYSLVDVFGTDTGELQITRSINGSGMSQAKQAKCFIRALKEHSIRSQKKLYEVRELKEIASDAGIDLLNFTNLIDSLNLQCILLRKGQNIYQFVAD